MGVDSSILTSFVGSFTELDAVLSLVPMALAVDVVPGLSANCTSCREEVEIRRAVSRGVCVGGSPTFVFDSSPSPAVLGAFISLFG